MEHPQSATPVIVPALVGMPGHGSSSDATRTKSSRSTKSLAQASLSRQASTASAQSSGGGLAAAVKTPPPPTAINFKTVMMAERFPVHSFEAEAPPTLKGSARRSAIAAKQGQVGPHPLPFYTAAHSSESAAIGLAPPKPDPVFNTAEENKRAARAGQVQYKTPALNRHRRYLKELAESRKAAAAAAEEQEAAKEAQLTKLRQTSKSIRQAIADGAPEKAKAKAFTSDPSAATPRVNSHNGTHTAKSAAPASSSSTPRPTPRGASKPAWAMTGEQADAVETAEAQDLLAFTEGLDIGQYLHDFEVRQAMEAVASRIDALKTSSQDTPRPLADDTGDAGESGGVEGGVGPEGEVGGEGGEERIDLTKDGWKDEFASWWNRTAATGSNNNNNNNNNNSDAWETSSVRASSDGLESAAERSSGGSGSGSGSGRSGRSGGATPRVRRESDMVSSASSVSRISRASTLTAVSSGSHASLKAVLAENMGSIRQVHSPASLRAVIARMVAQKKAHAAGGGDGDGQESGDATPRKSVTWAEQASLRGGSSSGTIQSLLAHQSGSGIGRAA